LPPHGTAKSELLNRLAAALSLDHRHYNASLIAFDDLLGFAVGSTTGGASNAVVTEHMVRQGVRRALVVTDGWVGGVPTEHAHALARRKGRFGIALTAR